jgi:hypothetical protein
MNNTQQVSVEENSDEAAGRECATRIIEAAMEDYREITAHSPVSSAH